MSAAEIRCVSTHSCVIAEGPVWIAGEQSLYWVDVGLEPKTLLRFDTRSGATDVWALPHRAAGVRARRDGGLLITYQRALAVADPDPSSIRDLPLSGVDFDRQRFNDSAVDPAGRLWIGTYDRLFKEPLGELYCIDASLKARSVGKGIMMSNGIAFSPDGRTLYHTDTRPKGLIHAWDFDLASGEVANRRIFADFSQRTGRPDGCAMDSSGCLWVAEVGAGNLLRFDPEGEIILEVPLPVSRPTSVCFGGKDLATLFVTSMTHGVSPEDLPGQPLAGRLLAFEPGISGQPQAATHF